MLRNIIAIDENKCNGCGQCLLDCAENALQLVDGKAKLVGEIYCDGLGACLSGCPTGALSIIQTEADPFSEEAVEELLAEKQKGHNCDCQGAKPSVLACGCSAAEVKELKPAQCLPMVDSARHPASALGHWPIKLALLPGNAPFLQGADLLLLADCAAAALPDLHVNFIPGKAIALACPKLDDAQAHIHKLAQVLAQAKPASLTVVHMEVPCCKGLEIIASRALEQAGLSIPVKNMIVSRQGQVQ